VRNLRRARRPLVALLALVIALLIGYGVRACRSDGAPRRSVPGAIAARMHT
jgi:hypothetical protein